MNHKIVNKICFSEVLKLKKRKKRPNKLGTKLGNTNNILT